MKPERKAMIDALIKHKGNVTRAAEEIDMNRENHYYWCHNDPEYKKAVDRVQDVALDFAEGKLFDGMDEMNMTAVIFYLKTRGKGKRLHRTHRNNRSRRRARIPHRPLQTFKGCPEGNTRQLR